MNSFIIKRIEKDFAVDVHHANELWNNANEINLRYDWEKFPYQPSVHVRSLYSKDYLYLRYEVIEEAILGTALKTNDPVHIDSCVEFFVSPNLKEPNKYFNFEMNCCAVLFLCYGLPRKEATRQFVEPSLVETIQASTSIVGKTKVISPKDERWVLELKIPFSLMTKVSGDPAPTSGQSWKANFYKCGDMLPKPHYGCWSKIDLPAPDFHRPEFFGEIKFE